MKVREIVARARGAIERFQIRFQLDQIPRYKACGETQPAKNLNKQPSRVPARSAREFQCLLGSLDARLHAYRVANLGLQTLVEVDEKICDPPFTKVNRRNECFKPWTGWHALQKWLEIFSLERSVLKGIFLRIRFEKKIERVDDRHVRNKTDFNGKPPGRFGKHKPRHKVAVRILLPIDEMVSRLDAERVTRHRRSGMRRRTQANDLRRKRDQPVIVIDGLVVKRDADSHVVLKKNVSEAQ